MTDAEEADEIIRDLEYRIRYLLRYFKCEYFVFPDGEEWKPLDKEK